MRKSKEILLMEAFVRRKNGENGVMGHPKGDGHVFDGGSTTRPVLFSRAERTLGTILECSKIGS